MRVLCYLLGDSLHSTRRLSVSTGCGIKTIRLNLELMVFNPLKVPSTLALKSKLTKKVEVDEMNIQFASDSRNVIQTFIVIAVLWTINSPQTFIIAKEFNEFNSSSICPTSTFIHISLTSFITFTKAACASLIFMNFRLYF